MKIAVLGPKGTFSENAGKKYMENSKIEGEIAYYNTIDDTFKGMISECDMGVVPVENTLDGHVLRTLDLLLENDVHITGELQVPVQFSFVANADSLDDVKRLYVQFKANGQCRNFTDKIKDKKIILTESNVESYDLFKGGGEGDAAIIPAHMLALSDARLKVDNVTDFEENYTRFFAIKNNPLSEYIKNQGDIKVSMCIIPEIDRPGILYEILKEFYINEINIVSLMSRPTKKHMGTYNFYMELTSSRERKDVIFEAIKNLEKKYKVKIHGIYSV